MWVEQNKGKLFRRRVNFFLLLFVVIFVVILLRLIKLQLLDSQMYRYVVKKQTQERAVVFPPRGLILDRSMNSLVTNTYKVSVNADPSKIKSRENIVSILANVFNKDKESYLQLLSDSTNGTVILEKKVNLLDLKGLDTLKAEGLYIEKVPARFYPYGSLASQVIGITDAKNMGVMGIELTYDKELTGKEGYMIMQKDNRQNRKPDINYPQKESIPGNNIVLTIDKEVQKIAEEELQQGVISQQAVRGKVVILSVKTGEILAIASYPTFDPNDIKTEDTVGMKNLVIGESYEPGSTFKIVTAAACIEEGIETPSDVIFVENGKYKIADLTIKDSYPSSTLTFQQVIEKSSNIGVAKSAQKVGPDRFYKYARDFGFGIYTGVDIRGEDKGMLLKPVEFTGGSLEFMSIGYQVKVNLLQLAVAYAAVANNGLMMKPFIVKKEIAPDGTVVNETYPSSVRQVISESTAKTLTKFFVGVVERGTGTDAKIEGMTIAGKTGTTQNYDIVSKKYTSKSHISSFVGYFPAENPLILIAVVIDDPKFEYYGGKVAAPVFKKIAERVIGYYGITSNSNQTLFDSRTVNVDLKSDREEKKDELVLIPNVVDLRTEDAIQILKEKSIKFEIQELSVKESESRNYIVESQEPAGNTYVKRTDDVKVRLKLKKITIEKNNLAKVPNVTSLSVRKAINKIISAGFNIEVIGGGVVMTQVPKAGSFLAPGSKVVLMCKDNL